MADENTVDQEEEARSKAALEAKKAELLAELKEERRKRREAEERAQAAEEKARAEAEEAAAKVGDVETVRRSIEERLGKQVETEKQRADRIEAEYRKLVIDGGLTDAMIRSGVAPQMLKGATGHFRDGRNFEIRDGQAIVDGVPLAQAVTEWAASEGSVYQAAGHATGGGAPGGGKPMGKTLADMTEAERLELARQGKLKAFLAQP